MTYFIYSVCLSLCVALQLSDNAVSSFKRTIEVCKSCFSRSLVLKKQMSIPVVVGKYAIIGKNL